MYDYSMVSEDLSISFGKIGICRIDLFLLIKSEETICCYLKRYFWKADSNLLRIQGVYISIHRVYIDTIYNFS